MSRLGFFVVGFGLVHLIRLLGLRLRRVQLGGWGLLDGFVGLGRRGRVFVK